MERLFSPCTRLHDSLESQGRLEEVVEHDLEPLQELNLDVSTEELLGAERAFSYADLYALLGNVGTVAWLTPHAAVVRGNVTAMRYWDQLNERCRFVFTVDGNEISAFARSPEHLLEISDFVLRLLAMSVVHSIRLSCWRAPDLFINAPTLAYLMEQCQSLKVLSLVNLEMNEDQCRALGAYSRPDLEIVLDDCRITSAGAGALTEVLGRNQGPTKLVCCRTDNSALANGLRGNSRLKSLRPYLSGSVEVSNQEVLAIAGALRGNKGLVDLDLSYGWCVNDETWGAICDSLKAHPTLEVLDCRGVFRVSAMLKSRIQVLVDMLKVNMSIHTILLHDLYSHHELFRGSVIPHLETNRFRPLLLAIQKTRPIAYRAKVLGRALLAVGTDPYRFWMLLSGNAELAFPSGTTTTAAAANLPAPAAAAATSTANVAAVAASVKSTLTTTATGCLPIAAAAAATATSAATTSDTFAPTAAANVTTASAGQKRKPRH
jgi:hypothetical protein